MIITSSILYKIATILEDNGYNQMIMFGSDASFGGRDSYFKDKKELKIEEYIDYGKQFEKVFLDNVKNITDDFGYDLNIANEFDLDDLF